MFPNLIQHSPQINHPFTIEFECLDCSTACRSDTDYHGVILILDEMFIPELAARMK
jgi:hypothetical protein